MPQALAEVTRGVASLNNFGKRPPRRVTEGIAERDSQGRKTLLQPNLTASGATNTYCLAAGDFAAIYNTKPLLGGGIDGTGIAIAITAQRYAPGRGFAAAIVLLGIAGIGASSGKGLRNFLLCDGLVAGIVSAASGCRGGGGASSMPPAQVARR